MVDGGELALVALDHTKYRPRRLTWQGHQCLADMRDQEAFNQALDKVKSIGGALSLDVFRALLRAFLKRKLQSMTGFEDIAF